MNRLTTGEVLAATSELTAAGTDVDLRAAWAATWGARALFTATDTERELLRYRRAFGLLQEGMNGGIRFFRTMADLFATLGPGRIKSAMQKAAVECGPIIVGKAAGAAGALKHDCEQERIAHANELIEEVFPTKGNLFDGILDSDLKVT